MTDSGQDPQPKDSAPDPGVHVGWWVLLIAASIVVRAALFASWGGLEPVIVDARDYDRLATTLAETGQYATPSGEPSSLRPPFYPAVVAGLYQAFGVKNYHAVTLAQSLISLVTIGLTYRLGANLYNRTAGYIAAAMVAFYPTLLAFNLLTLSEVLFTCLLTGAAFASLELLKAPSWGWAMALGVCLGLGALTRSILWLCAVPVAGYILLFAVYALPRRLAMTGVSLAVFGAILAPWAWRNTQVQQTFTLVDVMGGRNVMMGNYEHTPLERSWATISDVTGDRAWHRVLAEATPGYGDLTQGQIDKRAMAYGIDYFFSHPAESAKRVAVRFFNFWQLERTLIAGMRQGIFGEFSTAATLGTAAVVCGAYAAVALLAIAGGVTQPPEWRSHLLVLLWIAIPCVIHTAAFAHSRYHLPLVPLLAVYAAAVLQQPGRFLAELRRPRGMLSAVLGMVLIAGWAREIIMVDFSMLH